MLDTLENWDYCQITYQIIDDGRDPGDQSIHKLMWFEFQAHADGPNGRYTTGKTHKIPLANMMGAAMYAPQKENVGHTNTLQIFIQKLQSDGWELLNDKGSNWWEKRLRRPSEARPTLRQKISTLFKTNQPTP